MNTFSFRTLVSASCIFLLLFCTRPLSAATDSSKKQARVTRIIRDVKLMPSKEAAKPASLDDKVTEGTGVRTGDDSRSELTFVDLTITRLGENTIFTFDKAGRSVRLSSGSMLLRVPKNSGGASMTTSAITAGLTGTTAILESTRAGRNKLTILEGSGRISLNKYPRESANLRGGQMIDVPAGATKLPPVTNADLNQIMKKDPLITNFRPLPSQDLIYATAKQPPPAATSQPTGSGPDVIPILGSLIGAGLGLPINIGSGGGGTKAKSPKGDQAKHSGSKEHDDDETGMSGAKGTKPHASATPSKRRKGHKRKGR